MTWLTWRQFRTQAIVIFGGLLLLAIPTVVTGIGTRHWVTACATSATCLGNGAPAQQYMGRFGWLQVLLGGALLVLPAVLGMFSAAPLVAREFDTGTYRLAWTQSVSRVRWLTVKVAVVGTASVLAIGLLSWLTTWWFSPSDSVTHDKFIDSTFGIRDVAPIGYAVFAFAVGLAAGVLIRKVLPAMATTLGVFVVVRMVFQMFLRAHYATPLTQVGAVTDGGDVAVKIGANLPPGSWVVTLRFVDSSGHPARIVGGPGAPCSATNSCLDGITQHLVYQPGNRYWPFQWTEFGIFTLLGLLLIGFSYWWLTGHRLPGGTPRSGRLPVTADGATRAPDLPATGHNGVLSPPRPTGRTQHDGGQGVPLEGGPTRVGPGGAE